jgi:pyridinium-3,5-bisthiocarboxylic acid mononucleotide nickel chelatase
MKIAYFDCQFGAAGDMLNAALLSAGLDEQTWRDELARLCVPPGSFSVNVGEVLRCGIACKKVDVRNRRGVALDQLYEDSARQKFHGPPHAHASHDQPHAHKAAAEVDAAQHAGAAAYEDRGLKEILELIDASPISAGARELSRRIFIRLAAAEARVHGCSPEHVHFHEVGALDAIVDIVGFSIGYQLLGIQRSYCSAVPLGSGKTMTEHGLYPIPGPATVNLLSDSGAITTQSSIDFECLTPTGAAILSEVTCRWGVQPAFSKIDSVGYGGGSKDPKGWPNACRVLVGEADEPAVQPFEFDSVSVLQANIDDLNPQTLAFAAEHLLHCGALDVSITPALMKKGRSGHLLTVICNDRDRAVIQGEIFRQTSTLGVRFHQESRALARRLFKQVCLSDQEPLRIKVAVDGDGNVIHAQPEYEDCAAYARRHGLPLKEVINRALSRFYQENASDDRT